MPVSQQQSNKCHLHNSDDVSFPRRCSCPSSPKQLPSAGEGKIKMCHYRYRRPNFRFQWTTSTADDDYPIWVTSGEEVSTVYFFVPLKASHPSSVCLGFEGFDAFLGPHGHSSITESSCKLRSIHLIRKPRHEHD